jgi:hypothetical protein
MHTITAQNNSRVGRHVVRCRPHKGELQRMEFAQPRAFEIPGFWDEGPEIEEKFRFFC